MAAASCHRDREWPVQNPGETTASVPKPPTGSSGASKNHRRYCEAVATSESVRQDQHELVGEPGNGAASAKLGDKSDDLTAAFVRLSNLPTCPLDRLSRYEAVLWRQAYQILFALQSLDRRKPWKKLRLR
jgi:hypothetical protein